MTLVHSVAAAAAVLLVFGMGAAALGESPARRPLDPRGKIHIPIGIADTVDALKTFVEAEGNFSPGFATCGVYFWLYDPEAKRLAAPTMDGAACTHGLAPGGYLIPWSEWKAGDVAVRTEVCEVRRPSPAGEVFVVAARVRLTNTGAAERKVSLYAALRPLGAAGGPVRQLAVAPEGDALLVGGRPALVACEKPAAAGVAATDTIGEAAMAGAMPTEKAATSEAGDCSGALRFDLALAPGEARTLGLVCPVLPGRRAAGHQWDGTSEWAQFDLAKPDPPEGGTLQPDPGLAYYRGLKADALFDEAAAYWKDLVGRIAVRTPEARWAEALAAILGHAAMAMNEGAPDVAVVNYNVFNRDGVYTANMLQKAGRFDLAAKAIDYFLTHPFNGRVYPEADNPGQILWIMGEHWMLSRDTEWLRRTYSGAQKIARMIEYYRTRPGPHWVALDSLRFGDAVPKERRKALTPGQCDGLHPEYTEAFDVAGLWRASVMARALGHEDDAGDFSALADELFAVYESRFGRHLAKDYGSYCLLWPCRLYPPGEGAAWETFKGVGPQDPAGWRYFPLATAHQGLLAGSRAAAHGTLARHLDHEQMRGWYAFDEGGKSGAGGWGHARTTWDSSVAMPHGWAVAETWLLIRDALLFEDGNRLVLLGGVPAEWLGGRETVAVERMPTHFGPCSFTYAPAGGGAVLDLAETATPAEGFILRLPASLGARVTADGKPAKAAPNGDVPLPLGTKHVEIRLPERATGGDR